MRKVDAELRLACSGRAEDNDDPRSHAGSHEATVYITP
jgi:hypothetical protein